MCLGVPPSCGVHSLLIEHHAPKVPIPVMGLRWYARGCHACDATALEYEWSESTDP